MSLLIYELLGTNNYKVLFVAAIEIMIELTSSSSFLVELILARSTCARASSLVGR